MIPESTTFPLAWSRIQRTSRAATVTLSAIFFVLGALLMLAPLAGGPIGYAVGIVLMITTMVVLSRARFGARMLRRLTQGGEIALDPRGLELRGGRDVQMFTRENLEAGFRTGPSTLILRKADGEETELVFAPSPASASAIDDILHFAEAAVGQRAAVLPLHRVFGPVGYAIATFVPTLALGMVVGSIFATEIETGPKWTTTLVYALPIVLSALAAIVVATRIATESMVIGDDAIRLRGGFSRGLLPYASFHDVRVDRSPSGLAIGIAIVRNDAKRVRLPMRGDPFALIGAAVERIQTAKALADGGPSSIGPTLARAERSIDQWRTAIAQETNVAGAFRQRVADPEAIERVLGDAMAPIDQRVGAAIALRIILPNAQARIRIAAAASANPRLRHALETAAADELRDGDLEDALVRASTRQS